jgi:hypothetical protein
VGLGVESKSLFSFARAGDVAYAVAVSYDLQLQQG